MLAAIDYWIIALSLVVTMAVGLWCARKWRNAGDFFLAGRSVTWPFIGFSLFATNISSEHFVGLAAGGHSLGLVQGGYEWIASYCLLMLAGVFAPQYLKHGVYTIPEFFEKRFGIEMRMSLTGYFLVMIVLTKVAVAIYSGAIVIQQFFPDTPLWAILWGIGIFTAIYTMAGGLAAVIYTDFIQALILIAGSTVLTWTALDRAGGWSSLVTSLEQAGNLHLLSMVRPSTDPELPFSGFLLGNFLIGGMFYWCMDQVNVQRVLGAKSVGHARAGAIFAGFLKIIPVFIMVLPGVIATVILPGIKEHNDTYGVLLKELLPAGVRGFVIAALLAALMSSLSSTFNSTSTLVARDFVARLRPRTSERAQIWVGQAALVLVMVLGIACTPLIEREKTIWDYLQKVTGYLSVPFAVAGLLGILSRRVNRRGAGAAVLVGISAGAVLFCDAEFGWGLLTSAVWKSFLHRTALSAALSAVAMLLVSYLTAPPPRDVLDGSFALFRGAGSPVEARRAGWIADWRIWWWLLFGLVTFLWIRFR